MGTLPLPASEVSLREVTRDTLRAVLSLSVKPEQQHLVATNAQSIAEAHFSPETSFRSLYADDTFLDRARAAGRPVIVGEAAPVLPSGTPGRVRGAVSAAEAVGWYDALFALVERRREIKAVSLIAVDFERLASDLPTPGWPDTRLDAWSGVARRVTDELRKNRYIHRDELLAPSR